MKIKITSGIIATILSCLSLSTHSVIIKQIGKAKSDAPLIHSTDPGAERFIAVGKLKTGLACTATLISGSGTPNSQAPALILTAGHCANDSLETNQVIVDQPAGNSWTFTPDYFIDKQNTVQPVNVTRIVYATMKKADVAVLQLATTYGDFAKQGIFPLELQSELQSNKQAVELTHIPNDGIDESQRFLRHSDCEITGQAPTLYEGSSPWVWKPAFAVNCDGVVGGTSGSPLVLKGEKKVIGVLNTTVTSGYTGCGRGRPCEITNNTVTVREGASYFIPVDIIAQALTVEGQLDLTKLDNGSGDILKQDSFWKTQSTVKGEPAKWDITLSEKVGDIRFKVGPASEINCSDITGYSAPVAATEQPLKSLTLQNKEGMYQLCVIKKNGADSWLNTDWAALTLHEIDNTPPAAGIGIDKISETGEKWFFTLSGLAYEQDSIQTKRGAKNETNCNDKNGYSLYLNTPFSLLKENAPWRVCAYARDAAGNDGPVSEKIVE